MGLPLAMAAAQNNFEVTGFDINVEKVAKMCGPPGTLNMGVSSQEQPRDMVRFLSGKD